METTTPVDDASRPRFREPVPIFTLRDLPRSIAFFRKAVGYRWPAEGPLDEVAFIVLALGGNSVGPGRNPSAAPPPASADEPLEQQPVQLCLEVDDIHAAWDWALTHDARAVTPPRTEQWNEWSAFLDDPSGIRIMLFSPLREQ